MDSKMLKNYFPVPIIWGPFLLLLTCLCISLFNFIKLQTFLILSNTGDTGLRGPVGEAGIPGTKGAKGAKGHQGYKTMQSHIKQF